MSIMEQAKEFGVLQSQGKSVLANFALSVARAAEAGEIDESDADDIYANYAKMAWRVSKVDVKTASGRAQVSKIRQIIKLAEAEGVGLLLKVTRMHNEHMKVGHVKPLYDALIDVSRAQLSRTNALSDSQIMTLVKRK